MSNVLNSGKNHNGPKPQWTGGNHPRGKLYRNDGSGSSADNPGSGTTGGLADVSSKQGYTVIGKSPVQDDRQAYPANCQRRTKGIDVDFDQDGSYTGGTGNGRAR